MGFKGGLTALCELRLSKKEEGEGMLNKPMGWFSTHQGREVCLSLWMLEVDLILSQGMRNARIQKYCPKGDCDKSALPESPEDQALHCALLPY